MSPCATVVRSGTVSGKARFGGRELLALVLPARVELLELARGVAVSGDQRRAAGRIGEERRIGELRFRRLLLLLQLGDALLQLGHGALDRAQDLVALLALERALAPGLHALGSRPGRSGLDLAGRLLGPAARPVVEIARLRVDAAVAHLPDPGGQPVHEAAVVG